MVGDAWFRRKLWRTPLKRLIQREIADKSAVLILEGSVADDGAIKVDELNGELVVKSVAL